MKSDQPGEEHRRGPSRRQIVRLGIVMLWTAGATWLVVYADLVGGLPFSLPSPWYTNRAVCIAALVIWTVAGVVFVGGDWPVSLPADWAPSTPGQRFRHGRLFIDSRDAPSLRLKDEIERHARWFNALETVDVSAHPERLPPGCKCVPALEIDGRLRFRGDFRIELLRRLIQASPPLDTEPSPASSTEPA